MSIYRFIHISVLCVVLVILGAGNKLKAQPLEFGITGGVNISTHLDNFRFSEADINLNLTPKTTIGYQAGLMARKNLKRYLKFQAEPSVILLGASYEETFTLRGFEVQTDSKTELLYFRLPLLLQLSTAPAQQVVYGRQKPTTTYHLTGGIFGGYLLDAQFSGTNFGAPIGVPFKSDFSNDISSQYSNYDGGLILGAGFEHGNNNKVGIEARGHFSAYKSGSAPDMSFNPQNMAVTFAAYVLF